MCIYIQYIERTLLQEGVRKVVLVSFRDNDEGEMNGL